MRTDRNATVAARRRPVAVIGVVLAVAATLLVGTARVPCDVMAAQPTCWVAVEPGPMFDTRGLVDVAGDHVERTGTGILLTTIAVEEHLDLGEWGRAIVSSSTATVRREALFPAGSDAAAVRRGHRLAMASSQLDAIVAGLRATGHLGPDEHVVPGALPVDVRIEAGDIGGPSAGLAFALAVVEVLGGRDLTGDLVVAVTGSIDADGQVAAVGGVRQKIAGASRGPSRADVFLVPRANLGAARSAPVATDLLVVPVDDLDGALAALTQLASGGLPDGSLQIVARR
ncbi:MAG: S16 family serine protease [Nitriliruptoraceae bacterium]